MICEKLPAYQFPLCQWAENKWRWANMCNLGESHQKYLPFAATHREFLNIFLLYLTRYPKFMIFLSRCRSSILLIFFNLAFFIYSLVKFGFIFASTISRMWKICSISWRYFLRRFNCLSLPYLLYHSFVVACYKFNYFFLYNINVIKRASPNNSKMLITVPDAFLLVAAA